MASVTSLVYHAGTDTILLLSSLAFAEPATAHELLGKVVSIADRDTLTVLDAIVHELANRN